METNFNSVNTYTASQKTSVLSENKPEEKKPLKKEKKEKDIYNDSPLRKLGFLDEYGEALRPILSASKNPVVKNLPNLAYIPASAYMLADVIDKYQKGEDGTGEKPSVKMGVRQAMYQGLVSIAAPVAVVKGVHKLTDKFAGRISGKIPGIIKNKASSAFKTINKNKTINKFLSKAGMPAKVAGALISIAAISTLSKPIDFAADKLFKFVVDPLMGINKKEDK